MNKTKIIILAVIIVLAGLYCYGYFNQTIKKTAKKDFIISVNGKNYNVIVGKPSQKREKYPLVIYIHGGGYKTTEPFELRKLSQVFANQGFLVWTPEREPGIPGRDLETLEEAEKVSKEILNIALKHPEVDKDNINIVGFCLGSWAVLRENIYSPNVKSIGLLGFGAPFDNAVLYDKINNLVGQEIDYSKVSPKILVMVSKEDNRVDTKIAETFRQKMVQAGKAIDCIEYSTGNHLSLAGDKEYLLDLIKYLKGEKVETTDFIETNKQILELWDSAQKGGYW